MIFVHSRKETSKTAEAMADLSGACFNIGYVLRKLLRGWYMLFLVML